MAQGTTTWEIAGRRLKLSRLDQIEWPDDDVSKADLLSYYRDLAPILLPHFTGRPVTLKMFPAGIEGDSFYQRDLSSQAPAWLSRVPYKSADGRVIHLPIIEDAAGLVWLANTGAIEFHLWSSRRAALDKPDLVVFDLDVGEGVKFEMVLQAALMLHDALERLELASLPKTSGGRGVHVYVPVVPELPFEAVRAWVAELAALLVARHPATFELAHGLTHRSDRVTIDAAQNSIGRNTAAPYTARAFAGAPVSAPLSWDEVKQAAIKPSDFTIRNMSERVQRVGDLFARSLAHDQRLPRIPDQ